jgi:uncharacterized cupin superfamily protein
MERVVIDEVPSTSFETALDRRGLSDPLGTTDVALNRYRLSPTQRLSTGLHAHADQEEVFVVVEGELTFETEADEVVVDEGEAVRFAPGEFQSGKNDSEDEVILLAIGAPRETTDVRVPKACPQCDHDDMRVVAGEEGDNLQCPNCDYLLENPPPREEW